LFVSEKLCVMENVVKLLIIPEEEWKSLADGQAELLRILKDLAGRDTSGSKTLPFITAIEFMSAVRIGRTKFDQLVALNQVRTIKKGRKIYVPIGEVERYFKNSI
jgi:hypothetical protein